MKSAIIIIMAVLAFSILVAVSTFYSEDAREQSALDDEVTLKSCSGGRQDYYCAAETLYYKINNTFGLEKSDYELQCGQCNTERGGGLRAKGTYKDGSQFELYYHWGWCSSGGADCGWSKCFKSDSEDLFNSVKSIVCRQAGDFEKIEAGNRTLLISEEVIDGRSEITPCFTWPNGGPSCLEMSD